MWMVNFFKYLLFSDSLLTSSECRTLTLKTTSLSIAYFLPQSIFSTSIFSFFSKNLHSFFTPAERCISQNTSKKRLLLWLWNINGYSALNLSIECNNTCTYECNIWSWCLCIETWMDSRIVTAYQNGFIEILTDFTNLKKKKKSKWSGLFSEVNCIRQGIKASAQAGVWIILPIILKS